MAKRFTDTEIWAKSWYTELSTTHKLLTRFIWDNCNQIGLYNCNWPLACFMIGEKVGPDDLKKIDQGRQFELIEPAKIFVPGFCNFQYGQLNPNSPPHKRYIKMLQESGLYKRVALGYSKGTPTLLDKSNTLSDISVTPLNISVTPEDKEEDKEEVKEEVEEKEELPYLPGVGNLLNESGLMELDIAKKILKEDENWQRLMLTHLGRYEHKLSYKDLDSWLTEFFKSIADDHNNLRVGAVQYQTWFKNWVKVALKRKEQQSLGSKVGSTVVMPYEKKFKDGRPV
jgi:hypothetical protein